ncbi:MAG: acetyl-CoA carboxylase biotin carboxyl carrier protein [Erysipelothrix sp.]|nr:acetyl-CoA carboxylase biotin carboxyl carrier protein [Erysipelothrix sp.]
MYIKEVKKLIELLELSDLESITYKDDKFEVSLNKAKTKLVTQALPSEELISETPVKGNVKTLNAPLVGVFYSKPSTDGEAYVNTGQSVKEGDVVCIIEAMKVMNEIKADKSGVISNILVNDGEAVSFDQALFEIS